VRGSPVTETCVKRGSNRDQGPIRFLLLFRGSCPFTHCATSAGDTLCHQCRYTLRHQCRYTLRHQCRYTLRHQCRYILNLFIYELRYLFEVQLTISFKFAVHTVNVSMFLSWIRIKMKNGSTSDERQGADGGSQLTRRGSLCSRGPSACQCSISASL
jgi:hypothetical protein